jgi:hypothetical protein
MTKGASPPTFAFGQFSRSTHKLPFSQHAFADLDSVLRGGHLYALGCVLEERIIVAQGVRLGIFAEGPATASLAEDDPRLQEIINNNSVGNDWLRLPRYFSTEELLDAGLSRERSDVEQFQSMLRFRGYTSAIYRDYTLTLDLDRFYSELLFASAEQWANFIERSRPLADQLRPEVNVFPLISGIFEAVRFSADMLAWRMGLPLGDADPWGLSSSPESSQVHRLQLRKLLKSDEDAPQMVREAAQQVRDQGQAAGSRSFELLQEALLLKVLHFARLPEPSPDNVAGGRKRIIEALLPSDEAIIVQQLGSQFSWASALWRIAPTDERSLMRASESATLMSEALSSLREGEP